MLLTYIYVINTCNNINKAITCNISDSSGGTGQFTSRNVSQNIASPSASTASRQGTRIYGRALFGCYVDPFIYRLNYQQSVNVSKSQFVRMIWPALKMLETLEIFIQWTSRGLGLGHNRRGFFYSVTAQCCRWSLLTSYFFLLLALPMAQRVTLRKRQPYNTTSNRRRVLKTPGGKLVYHHLKKLASAPKCGDCGIALAGVPVLRPRKYATISKRQKTVQRAYGGSRCGDCVKSRYDSQSAIN